MSGIVGSVGSKSGVIGTTELDYESGTFNTTPMSFLNSGSTTMNNYLLHYIKIGNQVTITGNLYTDTVTSQNGALKLSLPFANGSGAHFRTVCHAGNYDAGDITAFKIDSADTFAALQKPHGWTTTTIGNTHTIVVNITYHIGE